MFKEAPVKTERYTESRRALVKHMADYSNTSSEPRFKEGVFAYLTEAGDVWLSKSKSLGAILKRHVGAMKGVTTASTPSGVTKAYQDGQAVYLFIGRPMSDEDFEKLTGLFEARNALISRKPVKHEGPGKLYRISHTSSGFYYLCSSRWEGDTVYRALARHIYLWQKTSRTERRVNPKIDSFITMFAEDLLLERGFTASEVGQFTSRENEIAMREEYIALAGAQQCLNTSIN